MANQDRAGWTPKVSQRRLRSLYYRLKTGVLDDEPLLDVGWWLYARAQDVIAVAQANRRGEVPCPNCWQGVKKKKIDTYRMPGERHAYQTGWFHCLACSKRLLWRDCRDALRHTPTCFACLKALVKRGGDFACACGKSWTISSYKNAIRTRIILPCPSCGFSLHRPTLDPRPVSSRSTSNKDAVPCPKCGGSAAHSKGDIICANCGYQRRWRAFRKSLKRRDEKLVCDQCGHTFTWQEWKKRTMSEQLRTGNMRVVESFVESWPQSRTQDEMMSRIDLLVQAIHGRGALGPVFIQGDEHSVRTLLDELAAWS